MPRITIDLSDLRQLPVTSEATIPDEYLDSMGHMNVMWYTHLFSMAMRGVFRLIGLSWEDMPQRQSGSFALESHIRYLSEVRVGQRIQVCSRILGRSEKRFHVMHFMVNMDKDDLASTHEMVCAYVDMSRRRMTAIPLEVTRQLDATITDHRQLDWPAPTCGIIAP
jgi:acyl-CoA thioester hydrolase